MSKKLPMLAFLKENRLLARFRTSPSKYTRNPGVLLLEKLNAPAESNIQTSYSLFPVSRNAMPELTPSFDDIMPHFAGILFACVAGEPVS